MPIDDDVSSGDDVSTSVYQAMWSSASPWKRRVAAVAVLLTLSLERLAFYSLAANLYLYLNRDPLNWMSYSAMTASYVFTGVAYLTSLLGGWIADGVLGKFWTIAAGLALYTASYSGLAYVASYGQELPTICLPRLDQARPRPFQNSTATAGWDNIWNDQGGQLDLRATFRNMRIHDPSAGVLAHGGAELAEDLGFGHSASDEKFCGWLMYVILLAIGVSVGIVRANIAPFGADQVQDAGPDAMRRFFNLYYWCVNIGGFVALGAVAYVEQAYGDGFFYGFLIAVAALGMAVLIFVASRPCYVVKKPTGSVLINVLKIVREAHRSRFRRRVQRRSRGSYSVDVPSDVEAVQPSWLDMAKVRFGGSFHESAVDDVKALGKILIVFTAIIPFWVVYFQMQTSFIAQGLHMKLNPFATHLRNLSDNSTTIDTSFTIPAAWLTLFDVTFLLVLIPVMDRIVYPFLDRKHLHLGLLFKISLGMMFALAAVVVAGCLEFYRLHLIHTNNSSLIVQVVGNTTYLAADLCIFWQVPQYALIGISEVFASVASLEFAYSRAPKSMQGIIMGLHCFYTGISSFVGTGLLEAVRAFWFTTRDYGSLNQSHLDYYFFLLGGIQLVAVFLFNLVAKRCKVGAVGPVDRSPAAREELPGPEIADDIEPIFKESGSRMTHSRKWN